MEEIYSTGQYLDDLSTFISNAESSAEKDREIKFKEIKSLFDNARTNVALTEQSNNLRYRNHLNNNAALLKVLIGFDDVKAYINSSDEIEYSSLKRVIDRIYTDSFGDADIMNYAGDTGFLVSSFADVTLFALQCYENPEEPEEYSPLHFFKCLLSVQARGFGKDSSELYAVGVDPDELGI